MNELRELVQSVSAWAIAPCAGFPRKEISNLPGLLTCNLPAQTDQRRRGLFANACHTDGRELASHGQFRQTHLTKVTRELPNWSENLTARSAYDRSNLVPQHATAPPAGPPPPVFGSFWRKIGGLGQREQPPTTTQFLSLSCPVRFFLQGVPDGNRVASDLGDHPLRPQPAT